MSARPNSIYFLVPDTKPLLGLVCLAVWRTSALGGQPLLGKPSMGARCTWSSGGTLDFRPLGPGFETQCIQVWGPFILHLIARRLVRHS